MGENWEETGGGLDGLGRNMKTGGGSDLGRNGGRAGSCKLGTQLCKKRGGGWTGQKHGNGRGDSGGFGGGGG